MALLEIRVAKTGNLFHKAFEWNLFLAWIPLLFSLVLYSLHTFQKLHFLVFFGGFCCWLLFFPNAPYLITDLVHLRASKVKSFPFWYDVVMIFSFAFSGLLCGLFSLYLMQKLLNQYFNKILAGVIIGFCLFLTSIGIYLGRMLRWNSWDIFNKYSLLLQDIGEIAQQPDGLLFIAIHSILLFLAYLVVWTLIKMKE